MNSIEDFEGGAKIGSEENFSGIPEDLRNKTGERGFYFGENTSGAEIGDLDANNVNVGSKLDQEETITEINKEVRIPKKIFNRALSNIEKNPRIDEEELFKLVSCDRVGWLRNQPFFPKLKEDVEFFMKLPELVRILRGRNLDEQMRKTDKIIRDERYLKTKATWEEWREIFANDNKRYVDFVTGVKKFIEVSGEEEIKEYWEHFDKLLQEEIKNGMFSDNLKSPETLKNGILGEIVATRLLRGFKDYLKDLYKENDEINWGLLSISVEEATADEDVKKQTDFFLMLNYADKNFKIPVQVKNMFLSAASAEDAKLAEEYPCSLSLRVHGREDSNLWKKMQSFYDKKDLGMFIILSHGENGRSISDSGTPSEELKELFYRSFESELKKFILKQEREKNKRPALEIKERYN